MQAMDAFSTSPTATVDPIGNLPDDGMFPSQSFFGLSHIPVFGVSGVSGAGALGSVELVGSVSPDLCADYPGL